MQPIVIEVFKTNVPGRSAAKRVIDHLSLVFPCAQFNFDLTDCDKILRIKGGHFTIAEVTIAVNTLGYRCEVLE
jgi:hypothetical protein